MSALRGIFHKGSQSTCSLCPVNLHCLVSGRKAHSSNTCLACQTRTSVTGSVSHSHENQKGSFSLYPSYCLWQWRSLLTLGVTFLDLEWAISFAFSFGMPIASMVKSLKDLLAWVAIVISRSNPSIQSFELTIFKRKKKYRAPSLNNCFICIYIKIMLKTGCQGV